MVGMWVFERMDDADYCEDDTGGGGDYGDDEYGR